MASRFNFLGEGAPRRCQLSLRLRPLSPDSAGAPAPSSTSPTENLPIAPISFAFWVAKPGRHAYNSARLWVELPGGGHEY